MAGSLVGFSTTHRSWWLVPLVLFLPDLFMAGYLAGTRIGAHAYNSAHTTTLPALMVGYGWWQSRPLCLALGLVWLGHIGMDRLLAFGLKYPDEFQHTHLSSPPDSRRRQRPVRSSEPRRRLPMSEPSPPPIEGLRVEVSARQKMTGMQQSPAVF